MRLFNKKIAKKVKNIHEMLVINEINYHDIAYLKQRIYFEKCRTERNQHKFSLILINWDGIYHVVGKQKQALELSPMLQKTINQICINIRKTDIVAIDESNQKIIILLPETSNEQSEQVLSRLGSILSSFHDLENHVKELWYDSNVSILTHPLETNGKTQDNSKIEKCLDAIDINLHISNLMNGQNNSRLKLNNLFSPWQDLYLNGSSLVMNRIKHLEIDFIDEMSRKLELLIKRIIDIIGASFGLIVTSPILVVTALLIKATSRGPVLFKQIRIGYRGKKFSIFKFRSMRQNASEETHKDYILKLITDDINDNKNDDKVTTYKNQIDNQITCIGSFIRKTSIDELPQLFNVLLGAMSLVGPRPHPVYEVELYKNWYYRRLLVKPGLAGLSKLNLRCTPENYKEAMRYDVRYVEDWSLKQDIKIILKTIPSLFFKNGAY